MGDNRAFGNGRSATGVRRRAFGNGGSLQETALFASSGASRSPAWLALLPAVTNEIPEDRSWADPLGARAAGRRRPGPGDKLCLCDVQRRRAHPREPVDLQLV